MPQKLSLEERIKFLHLLFRRWESWTERRGYVCQPGCAACCTTKVTMTELEGELIRHYCAARGVALPRPGSASVRSWRPGLTANQLAGCCLRGACPEQEEEEGGEHPAVQCRFLDEIARCAIYPVRPLACRVMASVIDCCQEGCAEVPAVHITVSAALSQIIEQLDVGNAWGNMDDILTYLALEVQARDAYRARRLLVCEPSPGWLIPDAEGVEVVSFLQKTLDERLEGRTLGEALGLGIIA